MCKKDFLKEIQMLIGKTPKTYLSISLIQIKKLSISLYFHGKSEVQLKFIIKFRISID